MSSKSIANTARKTTYYRAKKGIFGHTLSIIGIVKDHAKGTLHFHLLFFGGLSPYVLQRFAGLPDVCTSISRALDSMYSSSLPDGYHNAAVVRRMAEESKEVFVMLPKLNTEVLLSRPDYSAIVN
jgi:hypothetical protein